ncbi:Small ribosomal subunit biogenesis GTPase RsgA [Thalassocella blandensis]|nr:Small ribosomal subunit biogenesis GTPase RsgA [Thalassocella blandensis]
MAKRRLSKQQSRRIRQKQNASISRAGNPLEDIDEDSLGAERHGLVTAHFGQQVQVESESERLRCYMRANVTAVVTGDQVVWREADKIGVVESVLPRKSLLQRPDSYGNLKPVAANIDQILITIAPQPEYHHNLIDRYLVSAELQDIEPVLLINKLDLIDTDSPDASPTVQETIQQYSDLGYRVVQVSAKQNENIDELKHLLQGKTSIFVGQSGVGKSSLIKRLLPSEEILIGDLSEATKGRHTTTHSQLYHFIDGGNCIDSPGIREFGLWHLDAEQVIYGFRELRKFTDKCKFRNCSHTSEPQCALQLALEHNTISAQRFDSYQRIVSTINDVTIKQH